MPLDSSPSDATARLTHGDESALANLALAIERDGAALLSPRRATPATEPLRPFVRRLVQEARARDAVRAERMIIELRSAWARLPVVRRMQDEELRAALWDRIVELSCEEFYG